MAHPPVEPDIRRYYAEAGRLERSPQGRVRTRPAVIGGSGHLLAAARVGRR
jgi:hypothetical protein